MISFLSRGIARFLCARKIIDENMREVCQYGFEIMVSTAVGFLLVIASGIIFGALLQAILFYVLFVGVRLFTGGYHANTHLKCKTVLVCCCLFVITASKTLTSVYSPAVHFSILFFYFSTVIAYAPIEHVNAPLDEDDKKRNRLISVIMAILLTNLFGIGYFYFKKISVTSALTLFVISVLIIIPKIRERRFSHEKDCGENA